MNSLIVKLIFSICAQYAGGIERHHDEKLLSCYDKLVNCSNVESTKRVHWCASELRANEPYSAYIKRVRGL